MVKRYVGEMHVIFKDKELTNQKKSLKSYGVCDGSELSLVLDNIDKKIE